MASVDVSSGSKVISFKLGSSLFGIEILNVQEVMRAVKATRLLRSAPFVEGIIDFRGEVIPLIHLGKRLSLAGSQVEDGAMVIVVELRGRRAGLVVDSVAEIVTLTDDQALSLPLDIGGLRPEYIRGLSTTKDGLLIVLDVEKLLFPVETPPPVKKPEPRSVAEDSRPVSGPIVAEVPSHRPPKLGEMPSLSSFLSPKLREKVERRSLPKPPSPEPAIEDKPKPLSAKRPATIAKPGLRERPEGRKPPPPVSVEPEKSAPSPVDERARHIAWEEAPLDIRWEESDIPSVAEREHEIVWEEPLYEMEWEKPTFPPLAKDLHEIVWEEPPYELVWEKILLEMEWEKLSAPFLQERVYEIAWEEPLYKIVWEEAPSSMEWERPRIRPAEEKAHEILWEEPLLEVAWERAVGLTKETFVVKAVPALDTVEAGLVEEPYPHDAPSWWVSPIEIIKDLSISLSWAEGEAVAPTVAEISDEAIVEGYFEEVLYELVKGSSKASLPSESPPGESPPEPDVAGVGGVEKTIIDEFLGDL